METPLVFNRYRAAIDAEMKEVLASYESPLYDMMRYHLGWIDARGREADCPPGKALRPTLCLLSCEAVGADYARALPAAAAVELIHNFSLIHDDIQDDDDERRHRATVWKVWGKPQAINAGTAMRVLAGVALSRAFGNGLPRERELRMTAVIDEATLRLIEGQYLDIHFEQRDGVAVEEYLAMIGGKTAALIACSTELGALAGAGDGDTARRFREFGEHLGIAFQIRDDMLGIWGEPSQTGKPRGGDIKQKKKSLPMIFALSRGERRHREALGEILKKENIGDADVEAVLRVMDDMGVRTQVRAMADLYCDEAAGLLRELGIGEPARSDLESILEFLSAADY
jgi:geranylgeranyl diphosphate synthase, type I